MDGSLAAAKSEAEEAGLDVTFLHIPSTFDITVAGVFIEDPARRLVAFGSACRPTAEAAAAKAFTEAVGMHETGGELLDHDGRFWSAVNASNAGAAGHRPYRRYRSDRAYLDDYRPDWRDVNDVRLHLQLYLDPRLQDARLDRMRTPASADLPSSYEGDGLDGYVRMLGAQGLRAITVDLTTSDVRAAGLSVARTRPPRPLPRLDGLRRRVRRTAPPVQHQSRPPVKTSARAAQPTRRIGSLPSCPLRWQILRGMNSREDYEM